MTTRKLTILHSNDMHGDFLAEKTSPDAKARMIGGLALLSGYVNQVRQEEENVLYVIAGDMVQGSLIDSEYKGLSTMQIMNFLAPDVVTLGNHEFDYGLPHLLFLERVANFPIVNANLYIRDFNKRLMQPYLILQKAGLQILFTGIITDKVIDAINLDDLIGSFISLQEASQEVGRICNAYKNDDIDLTILLTHIGFDSDQQLASMLEPEWGVDMIIGGHSHTVLEEPACINNVLIAQAGTGTNQIGRFDITVDEETNSIVNYRWQLVPVIDGIAPPDEKLLQFIDNFQNSVDKKYSTVLCKLRTQLTHPQREIETSLGNLFADAFAECAQCDVMLVGSGSIRVKELGPVVTLKDFLPCFPYDDSLNRFAVNGAQLRRVFAHIMRKENRDGEGECYQVNRAVKAIYDEQGEQLVSLSVNGQDVSDSGMYTICMLGYHFKNSKAYMDITADELNQSGQAKVVSTSAQEVMEEYLRAHPNAESRVEGRLVYR